MVCFAGHQEKRIIGIKDNLKAIKWICGVKPSDRQYVNFLYYCLRIEPREEVIQDDLISWNINVEDTMGRIIWRGAVKSAAKVFQCFKAVSRKEDVKLDK